MCENVRLRHWPLKKKEKELFLKLTCIKKCATCVKRIVCGTFRIAQKEQLLHDRHYCTRFKMLRNFNFVEIKKTFYDFFSLT